MEPENDEVGESVAADEPALAETVEPFAWAKALAEELQQPTLAEQRRPVLASLDGASAGPSLPIAFAQWMAERSPTPIVLVDADPEGHGVARALKVGGRGVGDIVQNSASEVDLEDVVRETPYHNLRLVPAGRALTASDRFGARVRQLVAALESDYSAVLLALPPVGSRLWSQCLEHGLAPGVIGMVRPGRSVARSVSQAVASLREAAIPLWGCLVQPSREAAATARLQAIGAQLGNPPID